MLTRVDRNELAIGWNRLVPGQLIRAYCQEMSPNRAEIGRIPVRLVRVDGPWSDRRLREELLHLKKLGLVTSSGHGRGASWALRRHDDE